MNNSAATTRKWLRDGKERIFRFKIPLSLERALMNRLRALTIATTLLAVLALILMIREPRFFATSLVIGTLVMIIDYIVEYKGVTNNDWNYPVRPLSFHRIPIELPIFFFSCGILITFVFYSFSNPIMLAVFNPSSHIMALSVAQMMLLILGLVFLVMYFLKMCESIVFGALPISIAIYLLFPEPWILVISILPVYLDYYLEKRLVKSAHIEYDNYDEEVAINVAFSYFPLTLFILGIVALTYNHLVF